MAKRPETAAVGLSAADALAMLDRIELALDAMCTTAPRAVAAMGGRDAIRRTCQMTCIGPVPRLDAHQWERMSAEYVDARRQAQLEAFHSSRKGLTR